MTTVKKDYAKRNEEILSFVKNHPDAVKEIEDMWAVNLTRLNKKHEPVPCGVVYLSHPFGGRLENITKATRIANHLKEYGVEYSAVISPIHNYKWMTYHKKDTDEYLQEIAQCLTLLTPCDELVVSGEWRKSQGCCLEVLFALSKDIPIYEIPAERERVKVRYR